MGASMKEALGEATEKFFAVAHVNSQPVAQWPHYVERSAVGQSAVNPHSILVRRWCDW